MLGLYITKELTVSPYLPVAPDKQFVASIGAGHRLYFGGNASALYAGSEYVAFCY